MRVQQVIDGGIEVCLVPGWAHLATIVEFTRLLKKWNPRVLVCHGFSEHLWGRYAGILAKVPHIIHVEHNSRERYSPWRLRQARWLSRYTGQIVGVSEGVRQNLLRLDFPHDKTIAINNGINLEPYHDVFTDSIAISTKLELGTNCLYFVSESTQMGRELLRMSRLWN